MKRFASLIVAGLFAGSGMLTEPAAQEVPGTTEAPETTAVPAGEPVPFSEEPNLLHATELMQRAEVYAQSIAELSDVPEVEARQVSALPRVNASPAIFADTMNRFVTYYDDDIATLRSAMADNPEVAEALEAAGVALSDVVAAEIRPDLALRVYIRDW